MMTTHQFLLLYTSSSLLILFHFSQAKPHCTPSACGIITLIQSPFRLKNDPNNCGDRMFELACDNNVTSISLNSHKYYVKAINYANSSIRLVDASVNYDDICSFPNYSAFARNFPFQYKYYNSHDHPYLIPRYSHGLIPILVAIAGLLCAVVSPPLFTILGFAAISILLYLRVPLFLFMIDVTEISLYTAIILSMMICVPRIIIFPLAVWFLIYKFRRRRLSMFEGIESFLQSDNKLAPIRYSYADIKKMSKGFQDKLGEGGYGSVYKGKLRSGRDVAVKLLTKSGSNGQDFMNEIATIGTIHHVNVVQLVGYCAQGSKRALVFDFMPNGSLEKYLFNREKMSFLNWETKFEIAVGVARGIEYLHRGCDVQILHFDIKPHNILLDDNFIPKISDFGLAKFCSADKKTVTMTAARGIIGYVAPELISRSIGAVSYEADVYSFGMLLMEMVGLNRDMKGKNDDSSKYFPCWIYDLFNQGKDIEIEMTEESNGNEENESSRNILVRKMTIVALWCIQMSPDDRPSMNEVLQMLEGDVDRLQIPDYPSQSMQTVVNVDETGIITSTDSVSLLHYDDASPSVEIIVQELRTLP